LHPTAKNGKKVCGETGGGGGRDGKIGEGQMWRCWRMLAAVIHKGGDENGDRKKVRQICVKLKIGGGNLAMKEEQG
jgi:hypothetical protein